MTWYLERDPRLQIPQGDARLKLVEALSVPEIDLDRDVTDMSAAELHIRSLQAGGDVAILTILLNRNFSYHVPEYLEGLLHEAVEKRAVAEDCALLLLARGAPYQGEHFRRDDGRTVLHMAARHGMDRLVAVLVERGADVNARDGRGKTPLMWAERKGKEKCAALLREALPDARTHPLSYIV